MEALATWVGLLGALWVAAAVVELIYRAVSAVVRSFREEVSAKVVLTFLVLFAWLTWTMAALLVAIAQRLNPYPPSGVLFVFVAACFALPLALGYAPGLAALLFEPKLVPEVKLPRRMYVGSALLRRHVRDR